MREKSKIIVKALLFCWKNIMKYSLLWSIILIIIALISSFSILINARVLENMINELSSGLITEKIYALIIIWIISVLAMNLFSLLSKYINIHINADMEKNFLPVVIDKYSKIEYYQYESKDTQDLFQHINASSYKDIVSIFNISINTISSVIAIIEVLCIFSQAIFWVGLIAAVLTVPLVYFNLSAAYIEMKQRWTMTKDIRKRYYFQSLFADKNSLQEIKVFNSKDYFIDESEKLTQSINDDLKKNIGKVTKHKLYFTIVICAFSMMVIGMSSVMILSDKIELGTYVVLINSIAVFVGSEQRLSSSISSMVRTSEAINLLLDFFKLDEIKNYEKQDGICSQNDKRNNERAIEFENVCFSYPNSNNIVLNDVSFVVETGEIVSFVGINGSGKSTIIKLLCGLYKPDKGIIRINGIDISNLSISQITEELSVVFQDGQQYMLTLRENLGLGKIDDINNDYVLKTALESAGVYDLFQLDKGLDQNLGTIFEDAVDLSGGQWQRVLIARAFVKPAKIIILDEPTSSLDPLAECELYNTIHDSLLKTKRTSILISHRLASCIVSDKIMVLKDGQIYETGSHNELMNKKGYYAEMFLKQQSWYK